MSLEYNKWFIRLPPNEPPIVNLFKILLKPSIYTLKSSEKNNSTLTNTISHVETIRNTVTPFCSHLLVLIPIEQNHNQIQRNMSINKFLD